MLAANEPTEARCKWCALQMCIGTTSALTISTTKCTTPCEMADLQQVAAAVGASTQLEQSNTCISSYQVSQHFTCNARGWRTPWQTRRRTHGTSPTSANRMFRVMVLLYAPSSRAGACKHAGGRPCKPEARRRASVHSITSDHTSVFSHVYSWRRAGPGGRNGRRDGGPAAGGGGGGGGARRGGGGS